MNYRDPNRRAALAAEYALGTLHGPAKRRFERLLHEDFTLREEVRRWQNDLYPPLLEALPERPPPERVWQTVARQTRPPASTGTEPAPPTRPPGIWHSIGFWRGWSALASAAVLVLALYLVLEQRYTPPPPSSVTVLTDAATRPAWLIQVSGDRTRLQVQTLRPQPREADRSFQLWLLLDGERGPVSLGLLPASGPAVLRPGLIPSTLLAEGIGLAVSLEPAGGSPIARPTGPVLYQATLEPISLSDGS